MMEVKQVALLSHSSKVSFVNSGSCLCRLLCVLPVSTWVYAVVSGIIEFAINMPIGGLLMINDLLSVDEYANGYL